MMCLLLLAAISGVYYKAALWASCCSKYFLSTLRNFMSIASLSHEEVDCFLSLQNATLSEESSRLSTCVILAKCHGGMNLSHLPSLPLSKTKALPFSTFLLPTINVLLLSVSAVVRPKAEGSNYSALCGLGAYKVGRGLCIFGQCSKKLEFKDRMGNYYSANIL